MQCNPEFSILFVGNVQFIGCTLGGTPMSAEYPEFSILFASIIAFMGRTLGDTPMSAV